MDLNLARTFARVVESQGFSAAARGLGLPKSSVSRAVARLEEELGARLIERTSRRMKLTAAGRTYYEGAARALATLTDAERWVTESQDEPRGKIRLTVPSGIDRMFLASVVGRFVTEYPAVGVEVSFTNRVVDLVGEGYDLAVRGGPLRDSSLVARKVAQLRLWAYAAPTYLNGRRMPRRPDDLKNHKCILDPRGNATKTWELIGPDGPESVELTGSLYSDDPFFVRELVLRGAGIALMLADLDELRTGALVRVLPDYETPAFSGYVVVPSTRHLARRVAIFRDALVQSFKTYPRLLKDSATTALPPRHVRPLPRLDSNLPRMASL